jgi:hypothetical protein
MVEPLGGQGKTYIATLKGSLSELWSQSLLNLPLIFWPQLGVSINLTLPIKLASGLTCLRVIKLSFTIMPPK